MYLTVSKTYIHTLQYHMNILVKTSFMLYRYVPIPKNDFLITLTACFFAAYNLTDTPFLRGYVLEIFNSILEN